VAPSFLPDGGQQRVLDHDGGALLVTGGAGTGKSAALRERFARLIEGGADPERIALVVGSRRARDATRLSLLDRLPASLPGLRVLTMHGLAHHILRERHGALGYQEPPEILSAADQFARVQELLDGQDRNEWPAYGGLLGLRGFADEVRQFLLRAQESLLTPERIEEAAEARALTGWGELARFYREYQQVLDDLNVVDFAMLIQRAGTAAQSDERPLLDHLLVDDAQDSTFAAEALIENIHAPDLVVAGDPDAHVFSFQGTTGVPLARFAERHPDAATVDLTDRHRAPEPPAVRAWVSPHTSEEHATIARELRRLHVDEGVAWSDLAVVVRRQGAHLGSLLRALDDARIPRAVPERGLSLTAEPATFPYVLALRWLVADAAKREELIEPLLTSDVVGLSAATARGALRLARATHGSIADALDVTDALSPDDAQAVTAAREALAKASLFAGMSVQDAFRALWEDLPCSRRLVERAGDRTNGRSADASEAERQLDTVVTFANVVAEAGSGADRSVAAFVEALDAGEHGPGHSAWDRGRPDAVQVLTAHGAAGQEFDTVIVAGAAEGNFPSLSRPEPMFDLTVLDRPISRSERTRDRLEDERRLFRMVLGRARRRVTLTVSEEHPEEDGLTTRTRFAAEVGAAWTAAPSGPFDDPVSVREAAATWRRELADLTAPAALRLAALEGLMALGVDPHRWWFRRGWTDPGGHLTEEDKLHLSYSKLGKLDNCELQHVLSDELGLGRQAGYQAWVGKLVHRIIEDCETGALGRTQAEILAAVDARWREEEFPSHAVSAAFRTLVEERFLPNWWHGYGDTRSLAVERRFEFPYDDVTINGVIDRIGPILSGGTRITDFKTGNPDNAPKAEESLQLGIYYLAVQECEDLAEFRPVRAVELAFLKGHWRTKETVLKAWQVNAKSEEKYQSLVRQELSRLIAEKKRLNEDEVYRPRPEADCFFCEFKTLCPLYPEGATPLLPHGGAP
jgi:superfamily I DNA/RNA helicase/RecB family exonuclease